MTRANSSVTLPGGDVMAAHLPGDGKEYQMVIICNTDGHAMGSKSTYTAIAKLADVAGATALSLAFTANQERQIMTLHHLATAVRRKTLKRVELHLAATALTILNVEFRRITTAPVGGISLIEVPHDPALPAGGEAIAMAIPTTGGTYAANTALYSQEFNLGANTALTTNFDVQPIVIFPPLGQPADDDLMEPVIRAGVLEGYAISLRSTAAVTIKATARMIYTTED